jgi:MFS family permease
VSGYFRFINQNWPLLGFGFLTMFWGNLGQSFFLSWYGAEIQRSLELGASEYGLLYALATLCSALVIMAAGGMIDRLPLSVFTAGIALLLMLAAVVMSQVSSSASLALAFFLLRLTGQGMMPHISQTTMARYFDVGRGKAISLASCGVPVGEVLLPMLAVALIAVFGWQYSWLVLAASIPLVYLPLAGWLLRRSRGQRDRYNFAKQNVARMPVQGGRRRLLKDRRFWLILPAVLSGPVFVTGIFIQQGFILQQKGWSAAWLASCFIAYGALHWACSMLAGTLVDRWGAHRILPFITLPLFLSLLCLALLDSQWSALLFMLLLGVAMGVTQPVVAALWAELYGTQSIGAVRSLTTSLMILSSASAPWLFGVLIDRGASDTDLFGGSALIVLLAGLLVLMAFPRSQTQPK